MTATTIQINEGEPATWPDPPLGLPVEAELFPPSLVWGRLEDWTRYRLGERSVSFVVEGPGDWRAPLSPATISTTEVWRADAWLAETLRPSPLGGYVLDGAGPYRFAGTVGSDTVPDAFWLGYWRLAVYFAAIAGADVDLLAVSRAEDGDYSFERQPTWVARAIHLSGASDVLRRYRDLGAA